MTAPQPTLPQATLCFLLRGAPPVAVLLGYKKRGFGQGKWVGFGGKVEQGESGLQAAQRELWEETGLPVALSDLQPRGSIIFRFPAKPAWDQEVLLFVATQWSGEPIESEEIRPSWFAIDQLPFAQMWADAPYWLPALLAGKVINLQITFAADNATVSYCEPAKPLV